MAAGNQRDEKKMVFMNSSGETRTTARKKNAAARRSRSTRPLSWPLFCQMESAAHRRTKINAAVPAAPRIPPKAESMMEPGRSKRDDQCRAVSKPAVTREADKCGYQRKAIRPHGRRDERRQGAVLTEALLTRLMKISHAPRPRTTGRGSHKGERKSPPATTRASLMFSSSPSSSGGTKRRRSGIPSGN